ncbi:MAG: hypothetical protein ABR975_03330 [Vulcanimicrobiaceae bacterium]
MIALLAAAALLGAPPALAPATVLAKYQTALAAVREPHTFAVSYTLEQTGTRSLEQTHHIFRSGGDERDEVVAVNGTKATQPEVRIFHGRPYRYAVSRLAPRPGAYVFAYVGPRKDGHHVDYVFKLTPTRAGAFTLTTVAIDGVTFLPAAVTFVTGHGGHGRVTFGKSGEYWVAMSAEASAQAGDGEAHEQLTFEDWHFISELPRSTFAIARPLPSTEPAL